jgi:hypothetical protein
MSGMHVLNFEKSVYLMINARVSYTTISLLLDPNNTLHSSRNSLQNFRVNAQKRENQPHPTCSIHSCHTCVSLRQQQKQEKKIDAL